MARCPNCGSSAQVKVKSTQYQENGWEIEVTRYCICGCGETFTATSHYTSDGFETTKTLTRETFWERPKTRN